jgi:hypothetical protein
MFPVSNFRRNGVFRVIWASGNSVFMGVVGNDFILAELDNRGFYR